MNIQNERPKRRTARAKTILIDPADLEKKQPTAPAQMGCMNFNTQEHAPVSGVVQKRTFAFPELMEAFQNIEKRAHEGPYVAQNLLKRFKGNEEENGFEEEKKRMEKEIFPMIRNNPFLRNDSEIPFDVIDDRCSKQGRSRQDSFKGVGFGNK